MGGAVKKVVKVAKKVAPYAAVAAGAYYMTPALATANIHTGIAGIPMASSGFGLSSLTSGLSFGNVMSGVSGLSSIGGLAMQAQGNIQSQKYASQAAGYQRQQVEAQNKSDEIRNRYNQLQYKRQRLSTIRQARIAQGQIGGSMGGTLGTGGTSGYIGAIGSLGSQTSANIGNINVAEGYGNMISASNLQAANFGSKANTAGSKGTSWQNVQTLGGNIFAQADQIGNVVGKVSNIFT